jgi:heme-degrading monooxygenase HmoA
MQDEFLGAESTREEICVTVSYWRDLKSIKTWKDHAEHRNIQNHSKV